MRKRTILLLLSVALVASVLASPVDPQRAIQVAQQFVPKSQTSQRAPIRGAKTESTSSIVYTHMMLESDRAAFYIINVDDAFVIVSADDVAHQILGYNTGQKWPVSKDGTIELPEHIKGFFDDLALQIETATKAKSNSSPDADWTASRTAQRSPLRGASNLPDSVGPLLTTHWDQGQYYNALCPEDINGPDGHVQNGCVATAMAQIIKYWGDSVQIRLRGTHSYDNNYGTLAVDFGNESYDFANMPNKLTAESSPTQVAAVAKLMYHCGVATNMSYGATESSAFDVDARAGLINFYRFSPDLSYAEKAFFNDDDWNSLLRENIAASRPIIYSGHGVGDHSFILDGYKNDDYYHFNFGWGGFADGWYLTDAVNPGALNFSSRQTALVGIVPDNTGNVILGQTTGTSTFTVDEPLEFYHLLGHNTYEGSFYNNPCNNTITFLPKDDAKQLVVDIIEFEDQNVRIYNGTDTNNELRSLAGGSENNLSPIVSTTNATTINYTGNMYYGGFKLSISQDNGCRMVSNIVTSVEATTVHLTWTENGNATQWQVEYGLKGFELGNGAVFNSNTNTVTIDNLEKFTEYDFYIRSVIDNDKNGLWNKISIMVEAPYWQDVVTSQPAGYFINNETNSIEISTAEGLAWWAKNGCPQEILLTKNIDLSEYKWRPIYLGVNINGHGHIISNVYINETTSDVGLFSDCSPGTIIENVGLTNANVKSSSFRVGALFGTFRGIMRNCYVTNSSVDGTDYTGGLIGESDYGTVINCFVNANVIGNRWTSLMIGNSWQGTIQNCYAAGGVKHRSYCYIAGITAYAGAGEISNCYSVETEMGVVGYKGSTNITDTATFVRSDYGWTLLTPVYFDEVSESDLLTALNRYVEQANDDSYCIWTQDLGNENGGYPVLGAKYTILCPNVSDVSIQNVKIENENAVSVSWTENGDASQWRIRYRRHDIPNAPYTYITSTYNPAIIQGIPLGYVYDFNVQAIHGPEQHSGWSETQSFIVDLLYWTDIVTSQPEGYVEDSEGNVEISTVEGLAWLAVMVDGLNGQEPNTFDGKTVLLTSDINLDGYRWKPIGGFFYSESKGFRDWIGFSGVFDGQNHRVSNIYVNDAYSALGLFGHARNAIIKNIIIDGGSISSIYTDSKDSHALHSSAIGGLIGDAYDCSEINNCHSSVTIHANGGAGSLCGNIRGDLHNSFVTNCSASGTVYGREACGGLIGDVYGDVIVQNCFSTGDVKVATGNDNSWYRGGLIGSFMYATALNCYSIANVENAPEGSSNYGKVIGNPYRNTHIHYIYGQDNVNEGWELIGNYCEDIADTTQFSHSGDNNSLITPITIKGKIYTDMLGALNAWVVMQNDQNLKIWKLDSNTGYPVFGDNYEPTCYNPTDLAVTNATELGNPTIRTLLSWTQIGNPDHWEVLYVASEHEISEGVIVSVDSNPCVLTDIPVGKPLDFYVRAINDVDDVSNWSSLVTYIPDKLRWTEVVTTKPDGYLEDSDGNVYISSAEGLAWLSSISNGLNGIEYNQNRFVNKHIMLMCDIDLNEYRWTPIGADWEHLLYYTIIEGNNHIISGLYCNELANYQGLFGYLLFGNISNLIIRSSIIYGENYSGTIAGYAQHTDLINCAVTGNVYGIEYVGGITGSHGGNNSVIKNTSFIGNVQTRQDKTKKNSYNGYVGGITGTASFDSIINCYVVSEIPDRGEYVGIITGTGGRAELVSNCYYKAYETSLPITSDNCTTANNSNFSGSSSTWVINTPPYINGAFYTNLVDALNAWVNVNNSEGQYRHWVADTANINGGYPILAPLPNSIVTFQNYDNTVLQKDTLVYGSRPVYRGVTPSKEATAQYTFTFKCWTPSIVPAKEDAVYTAKYDSIVNKYVITFCNEGNTVLQTDTLEYGATPLYRGDTPVKEATTMYTYIFSGWSPELSPVTSNATYTAVFDAVERIYGDVTGNRIVDIQDATIVVNYILGERSDNYLYYMADMNNDEEIDIFDLTAIINVILGKPNFTAPMRASGGRYETGNYISSNTPVIPTVGLEDAYLQVISNKVYLSIDNTQRFTSFQMDVEVPDGAELLNVEVPGSKKTHSVQKAKIGDNLYRVIGLSMTSIPLAEENGELVNFQISNSANTEVTIKNILFVMPNGEAHYFNESSTMIPTILNEVSSDKEEIIFDLSGRRINKKPEDLDKGIYIINNEKVIIK